MRVTAPHVLVGLKGKANVALQSIAGFTKCNRKTQLVIRAHSLLAMCLAPRATVRLYAYVDGWLYVCSAHVRGVECAYIVMGKLAEAGVGKFHPTSMCPSSVSERRERTAQRPGPPICRPAAG